MKNHDAFERLAKRLVRFETSPIAHETHPGLDTLLDDLAGELAPDARPRLAAHLATCLSCQERLAHLRATLCREEQLLTTKSREPDLVRALARRGGHPARRERRATEWIARFLGEFALRPALAAAAAAATAAVVVLAIAVPLLRAPQLAASSRIAVLTREVESLEKQVSMLSAFQWTYQSGFPVSQGIGVEELRALVEQTRPISDPWQRALFVTSFLQRNGLGVPSAVNLAQVDTYTVRAGDTWETLATEKLGAPGFWPILWLLNAETIPASEQLSPGESLLVPMKR